MKKQNKNPKNKAALNSVFDLSEMEIVRREVSVDGRKLPLAIGDVIYMSENSPPKTVMGITVKEDGVANYGLGWFDEGEQTFKNEWVSMSELKLLAQSSPKKAVVKF